MSVEPSLILFPSDPAARQLYVRLGDTFVYTWTPIGSRTSNFARLHHKYYRCVASAYDQKVDLQTLRYRFVVAAYVQQPYA